MLDRASATERKASFGEAGWEPLPLPEVSVQHMHALSAFYRRRHFPRFQLGGHSLSFAPHWQRELPEIAAPWTLAVRIDEKPAEIVMPEVLLRFLMREVAGGISFESLAPDHLALILEFSVADSLELLETALGCAVSLVSARKAGASRRAPGDLALVVCVVPQGMDRAWCVIHAGDAHVHRLARGLDRIATAPAPGDLIDLPIPAHLRWASVDLTLAELKSLRAGDVVLVDGYWQEQESALAVIGGHLMAPVKILPAGYQFMDAPKRILGSGHEWCGDHLPMIAAPLRDGQPKDVPVRLFIDLMRLELSSKALRELGRGTQIGTDTPRNASLDLVVGGTTIGSGELTALGIGLGVRITRI